MAEPKTKPTDASVDDFLNAVADEQRRADAFQLLKIMKKITRQKPRMWGASLVGFGKYHYMYASGHEGDIFRTGFSPRKNALVLYFCGELEDRFADELKRLGKFKTSKGCLYINKLSNIDLDVLREMIRMRLADLDGTIIRNAAMAARKKATERKSSRSKRE